MEDQMSFNLIVKQKPWEKNKNSIRYERIFQFIDQSLIEKYTLGRIGVNSQPNSKGKVR